MTLSKSPSLYNQDTLGDSDFVAQFVARHGVLDALVRRLEAVGRGAAGGCQILIGPRGMGKTSLLRRLAIEIKNRPDLRARFIPLRFREEQYNVLKLGDFWRNCGEALAEWAEADGRAELAARLDAALPGENWAGDEKPADQFEMELANLNRRAVLLVDNLDLILDALSDQDKWVMRRHLQAKNGPLVIGAATRPLKDSADREAAFYEFFQPHHLEPLSESETEHCMRSLAERRGEHGKPVLDVLARQPERLKTLHVLTGGNPRVLALIYRLLESAESDRAMADLEILLDQVTPYYKARIEEYPTSQQRAVIDAIALHWDPITIGDLAKNTGVVATTLSPLLIKLKKDGLIESVATSRAYAGHQLVERFLNIWYLMRHGTRRTKQKMRWLVAFLSNFYSRSDLVGIVDRMRSCGAIAKWHSDYAHAFDEALQLSSTRDGASGASTVKLRASGKYVSKEIAGAAGTGKPTSKTDAPKGKIAAKAKIAKDLIARGVAFGEAGEHAAAIAAYDDVVARFAGAQEPALREQVAWALVNKGVAFGEAGDHAAAIAACDDVVARFAGAPEPALREQVAWALVNKGVAFGQAGDRAAAIAACDDVVARFAGAPEPALREQVARALVNKGVAFGEAGDHAAAIAAYDDVVSRFADAPEPALREEVARALVNKGVAFQKVGDHAAAITAYDDVVARFDDQHDSGSKVIVANAQVRLGNLLLDFTNEIPRAEQLFRRAAEVEPILAKSNLVWLYILDDRISNAIELREDLTKLPEPGPLLIDAGIQLAQQNFGSATERLAVALDQGLDRNGFDFSDDLDRFLRLAWRKGYGEKLIAWFEATGFADKLAPIHVALKAYIRGESALLDANPETRGPAREIFDRLVAPRRLEQSAEATSSQQKRRRGRPRKKS